MRKLYHNTQEYQCHLQSLNGNSHGCDVLWLLSLHVVVEVVKDDGLFIKIFAMPVLFDKSAPADFFS